MGPRALHCTSFAQVAHLWQRLQRGGDAHLTEVAIALGVEAPDARRGLLVARELDDPELVALVGTLSARLEVAAEGEGGRLENWRLEVLRLSDALLGFREAYLRHAGASLVERPRLETLQGRARLLEELRRDLLREPQLPLPESLQELLDDLPVVGQPSPLLLGLECG